MKRSDRHEPAILQRVELAVKSMNKRARHRLLPGLGDDLPQPFNSALRERCLVFVEQRVFDQGGDAAHATRDDGGCQRQL